MARRGGDPTKPQSKGNSVRKRACFGDVRYSAWGGVGGEEREQNEPRATPSDSPLGELYRESYRQS